MITRPGWMVAGGSAATILAARLLGSLELFVLGVIGLAVVVGATGYVWVRRVRLTLGRQLRPQRVHAGGQARIDLSIRNDSRHASPVLQVHDPVSGTRGANLLVGPLQPSQVAHVAYRLPTERRGLIDIGPMDLTVSDPFGLARLRLPGAGASKVTVYPPMHRLSTLPPTGGADPNAGMDQHRAMSRGSEDFHALRPFMVGDELRRVHWPSSARHDELLVRQDQVPWQGRLSVVLDNSAGGLPAPGLDLAATVAASVLRSAHDKGNLVRLVTADGNDSGFRSGNAQMDALLELLAVVAVERRATLTSAMEAASSTLRRGCVVIITGDLDTSGHQAMRRMARAFSWTTLVVIDASAWDPSAPVGAPGASRRFLRLTRHATFPAAWHRAMSNAASSEPVETRDAGPTTVPGTAP